MVNNTPAGYLDPLSGESRPYGIEYDTGIVGSGVWTDADTASTLEYVFILNSLAYGGPAYTNEVHPSRFGFTPAAASVNGVTLDANASGRDGYYVGSWLRDQTSTEVRRIVHYTGSTRVALPELPFASDPAGHVCDILPMRIEAQNGTAVMDLGYPGLYGDIHTTGAESSADYTMGWLGPYDVIRIRRNAHFNRWLLSGFGGTVATTVLDDPDVADWTAHGIAAGDLVYIPLASGGTAVGQYRVTTVHATNGLTLSPNPGNGTAIQWVVVGGDIKAIQRRENIVKDDEMFVHFETVMRQTLAPFSTNIVQVMARNYSSYRPRDAHRRSDDTLRISGTAGTMSGGVLDDADVADWSAHGIFTYDWVTFTNTSGGTTATSAVVISVHATNGLTVSPNPGNGTADWAVYKPVRTHDRSHWRIGGGPEGETVAVTDLVADNRSGETYPLRVGYFDKIQGASKYRARRRTSCVEMSPNQMFGGSFWDAANSSKMALTHGASDTKSYCVQAEDSQSVPAGDVHHTIAHVYLAEHDWGEAAVPGVSAGRTGGRPSKSRP